MKFHINPHTGRLDRDEVGMDSSVYDSDENNIIDFAEALDDGAGNIITPEQLTKVTKVLYVDGNRTDSYTENGSITKPFKTIQSAITASSGNVLINVAPGEYSGDFSLGTEVVSIRGSGINATFFTGNVTAGDRAHSLDEFRIKSTGSLIVTDNIFARNLHLECATIVSGSGFLNGTNIYIKPVSGVVPLTLTSTGGVMLNEGSILGSGNVHAINQSSGTIVMFHSYAKNSSLTTATINSSAGVLGIIDSSVYNIGFGIAVNMDNGGSALSANSLRGMVCSGNIVCGSATTYVGGLNFVGFGVLSGSALIYKPASRLKNDSSVVGITVKDALETLDAKPGVTHLVKTNTILLQANGVNSETINHSLTEQFVQATVVFKPSAGTYSGQWINGEGVLTIVYFDANNIKIYNDSGSNIAIGDCAVIIQK